MSSFTSCVTCMCGINRYTFAHELLTATQNNYSCVKRIGIFADRRHPWRFKNSQSLWGPLCIPVWFSCWLEHVGLRTLPPPATSPRLRHRSMRSIFGKSTVLPRFVSTRCRTTVANRFPLGNSPSPPIEALRQCGPRSMKRFNHSRSPAGCRSHVPPQA